MTELRNRGTGHTIPEYLRCLPASMDDAGWGFNMIVPRGRSGYGLRGQPLLDFIRASLRTLLDAGAVPAEFAEGRWQRVTRWGDDRTAIIEGMISDWLDGGAIDAPDWGQHWLMWPKYLGET